MNTWISTCCVGLLLGFIAC